MTGHVQIKDEGLVMRSWIRVVAALALVASAGVVALAGCHTTPPAPDRGTVSAHLSERVGHTVGCDAGVSGVA